MAIQNPTAARPQPPKDYSQPGRLCDIVMKGGITSGVIYPAAVCEIATAYSFKNIGGTSAGAIAAAATAAAEYARRKGNTGVEPKRGFRGVEELPEELAKGLSTLFQPNRPTAPLFAMLNAVLDMDDKLPVGEKVMTVARALTLNFPDSALLGMLPGLFLFLVLGCAALWVWSASGEHTALWVFGFVILFGSGLLFALLLTLLFRASGAALGLVVHALRALPGNNFGLCNGMKGVSDRHKPLTEWLADKLDGIAGKNNPQEPLTFGDLKGATSPLEDALPPEEMGINLEMMTTNITLGRPYRLPSFGGSREFFFDPKEFGVLFPKRIVDWMVKCSQNLKPKNDRQAREWESFSPKLKLPEPEDLPVVVATRLSLSFPVLLSAVPLYMVDRTRGVQSGPKSAMTQREDGTADVAAPESGEGAKDNADPDGGPRLEKCWFSDGGICSNFPIHFFDRPLPRWPTFGINLRPVNPSYHRDGQPEREKVYMVKDNSRGLAPMWDRFDQKNSGIGKLGGFFAAIVNTMYNWADNLQTTVPGYRDRVVHIHHTEKEGGLNLNMGKEVIDALSERGTYAGEMLRTRFTGQDEGSELSWDTHRWTRYRTLMSLLEKVTSDLRRAYRFNTPGDDQYPELIEPSGGEPPKGYPMGKKQRAFARAETEHIIAVVEGWKTQGQTFRDSRTPSPEPDFRIRPDV